MEKIRLEYTHDLSVARIILDDGKGNVLDGVMMKDLHNLLTTLFDAGNIKMITFEGAGKNFSFGASVKEHTKEQCGGMLKAFHRLFYDIVHLSIPTTAKISGQCLGGGMELALACNFLFADKSAMMGQPEIMLGVFAPPASLLLPLKIGPAKAEELLLTGNSIPAETAKEIGLINEVYEDKDAMDAAVDEWISKDFGRKSASSLRMGVKAARILFNEAVLNGLPKLEKMYVEELMETDDANEGIISFMEKRKPVWRNK